MTRWFRHYAGMMRDEKLVAVAIRAKQPVHLVTWVWGAILESAAEKDDAGLYEVDAAEVAYFLRTDEADIRAILDALADAGRLAGGAVVKWGDRQYQSDKSAERQARYRERRRSTDRDSDDQQASRDVTTPSPDRHVTPQETDTELEEEEERNISLETEREFEDWYAAFPKHVGKGQARRSYRAARRKTSAEILLAGAKRAATTFTDPRFTPHPSTWLNGERWLDADALGEPARPAYDWDADPANKGVH